MKILQTRSPWPTPRILRGIGGAQQKFHKVIQESGGWPICRVTVDEALMTAIFPNKLKTDETILFGFITSPLFCGPVSRG
ncbi:hypothetical protein [Pseudomonas fluorescens]|uniref:hypothetical protein n=1 Tax=Pseudomonas fluorescens TaxID=294 RepID=UPI001BE648B0|nr:hypothetical protein [Pseudomonas fluorescens]MBT2296885.1 hypothetical protein [Pseudomonas fluorescens]MBT2307947.1 hypothetical protein [Pseudomonas fluorescens]MBT2312975.1 hypothetical protein [Pseudomonas fluorescens]MBT2317474.1 hypothetical protein [Pseudomonas fluorescens]MBT2343616.1 hypothetical protein [Pseudomonas fluorescens]